MDTCIPRNREDESIAGQKETSPHIGVDEKPILCPPVVAKGDTVNASFDVVMDSVQVVFHHAVGKFMDTAVVFSQILEVV